MTTVKFVKSGHLPKRKDKKTRTAYRSSIPPRDLKFWFVVGILLIVFCGLIYILLKVS